MSWGYVAVAAATVVAGYMSSEAQKDAAETAADAQTGAADEGVIEQRRQFNELQKLLAPYVEGGETAFTAQQALIGLGGPEAQRKAISAIEGGPAFEALTRQGEEGILANASATGGLRGGNVQGALSQFRPQVLSQLIESQYSKLGDISQMGQASAAGVGAGGMQSADAISQLLQQSGEAQAQSALAGGKATADMWGNVAGAIGTGVGGYKQSQNGKF